MSGSARIAVLTSPTPTDRNCEKPQPDGAGVNDGGGASAVVAGRRRLSHRRRRAIRLVRSYQLSDVNHDPSEHRQIATVELATHVRVPPFRARTTHAFDDGDLLMIDERRTKQQ